MPIAAQCPNCGGPLSETSVLALAPVCERCGTVITKIGGTLGLTGAYGVNDPTITRKRVEADLAVFGDYRNKYVGMLEACKEQLTWGVERYAKLPNSPELLPLVPLPRLGKAFLAGLLRGAAVWFFGGLILAIPYCIIHDFCEPASELLGALWLLSILYALIAPPACDSLRYYRAAAANGKRPLENAHRQASYEAARAAAMKAAEPVKAGQITASAAKFVNWRASSRR